ARGRPEGPVAIPGKLAHGALRQIITRFVVPEMAIFEKANAAETKPDPKAAIWCGDQTCYVGRSQWLFRRAGVGHEARAVETCQSGRTSDPQDSVRGLNYCGDIARRSLRGGERPMIELLKREVGTDSPGPSEV